METPTTNRIRPGCVARGIAHRKPAVARDLSAMRPLETRASSSSPSRKSSCSTETILGSSQCRTGFQHLRFAQKLAGTPGARQRRRRGRIATELGIVAIIPLMRLPFDRARLTARNELDRQDAWRRARQRSPAERLRAEVELSDLVTELRAVPTTQRARRFVLAAKSRLWVAPLKTIGQARPRR